MRGKVSVTQWGEAPIDRTRLKRPVHKRIKGSGYMNGNKYKTAAEMGWATTADLLRLWRFGMVERPIKNAAGQWVFIQPNVNVFPVVSELKGVRPARAFYLHHKGSVTPCRTKLEAEKVVRSYGRGPSDGVHVLTGTNAYVLRFQLGWSKKSKTCQWEFVDKLPPESGQLSALTPATAPA